MEQKKIAAAFVGHFVSLGAHVIGARTVESILQIYAPKFTRGLKAEFYGNVSHGKNQIYLNLLCIIFFFIRFAVMIANGTRKVNEVYIKKTFINIKLGGLSRRRY